METGCLWLFEELLWSCFLDDESSSILGLWRATLGLWEATLGLVGEDSDWPRDASDGNLGWLALEEDLNTPTFLRVMTSSAVYSSRSPAMPQKSMSLLVKGPTVMKGASFPVLGSRYGSAWLHRMTISGKRSCRELHTSRNEKAPIASSQCVLTFWAVPHE